MTTKESSYTILVEVQKSINRLEDKVDKRVTMAENRLDKLEDTQSKLLGGLAIVSMFIGGAVTWAWDKITGK